MADDATTYRALSSAFRRNVVAWGQFKPNEVLLLLILCDETFDRDRASSPADLARWARMLALRPDKLERLVWRELRQLQVIDYNPAQGTYELRPDPAGWMSFRTGTSGAIKNLRSVPELELNCERPVDEALSSLSREAAMETRPQSTASDASSQALSSAATGENPPPVKKEPDWNSLRAAVGLPPRRINPPESVADKSSLPHGGRPQGMEDKSAGDGTLDSAGFERAADLSATSYSPNSPPLASLALVQKAKLAMPQRGSPMRPAAAKTDPLEEKSARISAPEAPGAQASPAEAWKWLQEIDSAGHLQTTRSARQWQVLCEKDPKLVLKRFRGIYDADKRTIQDPLAYLSRICRDERRPGFV